MELSKDQIELMQGFIDDCMPGEYDAEEIIPPKYRYVFASETVHGKQFKTAVERGAFKNIEHMGKSSNNHQRYRLHGG